MRYPALDARLQAAADLFTACDTGADIGADHGRLSCYLLHTNRCHRMVVADISADSLSKAQRLLTIHGLDDRAEFRVADGLSALDEPVGCIAICGMGGRLMGEILKRGQKALQDADLVLSCHTEIPLLRTILMELGYHIDMERLVRAKNRFYIVIKALPGAIRYTEKEIYLGPVLIQGTEVLWQEYLRWRASVVRCEQGNDQQLSWIMEELVK